MVKGVLRLETVFLLEQLKTTSAVGNISYPFAEGLTCG